MSDDLSLNASVDSFVPEQQTSIPSFMDQFPEDIRSEACLRDFKDIGSLGKSYVSAQRMLGSSIRIPGEDASQESRQEFLNRLSSVPGVMLSPNIDDPSSLASVYNTLGRPAEASQYQLNSPTELEIDDTELQSWNKEAHALGLTQKQYEGVLAKFVTLESRQFEHFEESKIAGEAALRQAWGNDYTNRISAAQAVAQSYSEKYPEAMQQLIESPAGNNPALLSMMAELAPIFQERGMINGQSRIQLGLSSDEARAKIQEIEGNMSHPIYNSSDPNHQAAVERRNQLYAAAYPEN